jgi:hypothetical protein
VKPSKAVNKGSINPKTVTDIKSKIALKNEDDEDMVTRIDLSAYYKSEARGYEPGHEIQDWLEAEEELRQ